MSERPTKKREMNWSDEIPVEEDSQPDPYEKTYRDGSAVNECWSEEGAGKKIFGPARRSGPWEEEEI